MYHKRLVEDEISQFVDRKEAVIVTGMRRVGKTTLLRHVFDSIGSKNKAWFDFGNPIHVRLFEDVDYNDVYDRICEEGNLRKNERVFIFIDEVQHFPEISKIVKYLIDHFQVKFFLTGSASYYLKNLFPESLAGRKHIVEMYPLTFGEFLEFKGVNTVQYRRDKKKVRADLVTYERYDSLYSEFLRWGGFPGVALEEDTARKQDVLDDIFSSYYQNEIVGLSGYRKNKKVRELILLLAARVGSKVDITKLSQELGITRATVYAYLSFLEATYFFHFIKPFSRSADREVSGAEKVYACDTGLLQTISKVNEGQVFENAVFNQLRNKTHGVRYYQRRDGAEIDFIVEKNRAFEVKKTASPVDRRRLKSRAKSLNLQSAEVVSQEYVEEKEGVVFGQFL